MMLLTIVFDINYIIATVIAVGGITIAFSQFQKASIERNKQKYEAEVEKERIKVQGEVDKERERSVGAQAILKIWNVYDKMEKELVELTDCQQQDHSNNLLMNEIIGRLKEDLDKVMKFLWDNFLKR